jgi:LacI family transcriptional regulator
MIPKMTQNSPKVTIQDVAREAGVSVSTISRVLNQKDDVSIETQRHVREVIDHLGYTSTLAARSMRSRKTNVIGLIVPDAEHPFSLEVIKGVNHAIAQSDYDLLIYTTGDFRKQNTALHEKQYVSLINGTIADGVIVLTSSARNFSSRAPLVFIDPYVCNDDFPTILADNYTGAHELMRYLVELGHRRIAYISGREGLQNNARFKAYQDVLSEFGITYEPDLVVEGDFSTRTGRLCGKRLLALQDPPTAIFAANDQAALGVIEAAQEANVKIPDDLSLAGFDNIPEAAILGLTTVSQPMIEMGSRAVDSLFRVIKGLKIEEMKQVLPTRLVVRNSCKSLPGGM